ncbi:double-strand-break repair protein rad21 homolog isoform X1 [Hydra vulgaris]|uniref:double-strand-break repair protein rad21 homolog isoform X1 n=1 Tax=Hydra vulgaris TaxID=6087 RepID=UPI001F5EEED1|nr:double-strand-break repair protein rad21 homolog isoform X1 [Hydra vulgaris]XP_047124779.1 double-strand-break repair protein rad21 homolog isoform X1 [Hydra vulgaris]
MFYPQGITLCKKEKLSLIWLAANYDPEKYKKMISAKDCENVNIARICHSIINPKFPFALRLSAQLMLGTVRIYRTKTKILLYTAEQMMLKLSTILKEVNYKSCDLPVATLREDVITLPDFLNCESIIDYTLGPLYLDANMLLHIREADFFPINNTPLQSPVKFEKHKNRETKFSSPLTVSNRQISIEESIFSPSKTVIQLPGVEEFEGNDFGPAQAEFLHDLNFDHAPLLRPNYKKRLAPLFENEEDLNLTKNKKDYFENVDRTLLRSPQIQRKDDLKTPLADTFLPLETDIDGLHNETDYVTTLPTNFADETEVATVMVEKTVKGKKQNWNCNLVTPAEAIILKPNASNPKRKRKLFVDDEIALSSQQIKSNLATPDTLLKTPIIAGTALPNAKSLFLCPSFISLSKNKKLKTWWDNNSCWQKISLDDLILGEKLNHVSGETEILKSPEHLRRDDESLGSIEIARNASSSMRSLEQSAGSTLLVEKTPLNDDDPQMLFGMENMIDFNDMQHFSSPRISGIGALPNDIIVDLNDQPGLEPVLEQDETLLETDNENQEMSKRFLGFQRKIQLAILHRPSVDFFDVFPTYCNSRKDIAIAFYTALNLHRCGKITLNQKEIFGPITISSN